MDCPPCLFHLPFAASERAECFFNVPLSHDQATPRRNGEFSLIRALREYKNSRARCQAESGIIIPLTSGPVLSILAHKMIFAVFASRTNNDSQAANEGFSSFPEMRLTIGLHSHSCMIIGEAKWILSRGEADLQRPPLMDDNKESCV
jgi:hypothetical protein